MRIRNVGPDLQMKVMRYLEYVHSEETSGYQRGDQLIRSLSSALQQELNAEVFRSVVSAIPLIKDTFSAEFRSELAGTVKEKFFAPDEIIVKVASLRMAAFLS